MSAYVIYICGTDETLVDPNPDCPNREEHAPQPRGYVQWFEWAARKAYRGWTQRRCDGCGLLNIWVGGRL